MVNIILINQLITIAFNYYCQCIICQSSLSVLSCIESIQRTSTKSPIKEYANAKDIMDETKQVENRQTTQSIQYDITTEDTELRQSISQASVA